MGAPADTETYLEAVTELADSLPVVISQFQIPELQASVVSELIDCIAVNVREIGHIICRIPAGGRIARKLANLDACLLTLRSLGYLLKN